MRSQLHRQGSAPRIEHIDPGNMWGSRALEMNRPVEVQQLLIAASRRAAGDSIREPDRQTTERSMILETIRYDRIAGCTGLTGEECGGQTQPQAGEAISLHHVTLARSLSCRIDPGAWQMTVSHPADGRSAASGLGSHENPLPIRQILS
jgi:hypothetical protein